MAGMALRRAKEELSDAQVHVSDLKVKFTYLYSLIEEFFGFYETAATPIEGE